MHYEGDGKTIDLLPNSGSSAGLTNGGTTIQDVKGYPFGSPYTDGSTLIEVGLGVLLGTGEGTAEAPTALQQGAVILGIEKVNNDLRVTWAINTVDFPLLTGSEQVDIYYMVVDSGEPGQYNKTAMTQLIIDADVLASAAPSGVNLDGPKAFKWNNQAGTGHQEIYFIGCINDQASHADYGLAKAVAVGKLDLELTSDYNFVSMPMYMINGTSLTLALSGQADQVDIEIYNFDESSGNLVKAKYKTTGWEFTPNLPFAVEQGKSYWVRLPSGGRISLLGAVSNADFMKTMLASRYLVLGNAFPLSRTFDDVLPASGSNELYLFHNDTKILEKLKNNGSGTWINAAPGEPVYNFIPGAGFWYRNQGAEYDWTLTNP